MFSRLFGHQPLYFEPALHLLQYIDGEPANNYSLTVVPKCSQPVIDQQCSITPDEAATSFIRDGSLPFKD